jgi:penicillin amidase
MKMIRRLILFIVLVPGGLILSGWLALRGSLPQVDGSHALAGLDAPVTVSRDRLGVPTVDALNLEDLVRAVGFIHAQDRFFQMDLLRRSAAGELSELFGARALDHDRSRRVHRLRHVARAILARLKTDRGQILDAYTDGVNAGVAALQVHSFEYLLLRETPETWLAEDSILVVLAMYADLQDENAVADYERGFLRSQLPESMYRFLFPAGTRWDAALDGGTILPTPPPSAAEYDLRSLVAARPELLAFERSPYAPAMAAGSNNWALAGHRTAHGGGLLANDMHLTLRVPTVWYRARYRVTNVRGRNLDITGVTLPGTPLVIVGSNGRVAWGYTNSYGDWADRVILESHPDDDSRYLTADGYRDLDVVRETIQVKGGESVELTIKQSIWGPVVGRDYDGKQQVIHWLAAIPEATNVRLLEMMFADSVHEALRIAPEIGMPNQNLVVADDQGNIGWTIVGRIPRRNRDYDPRLPASWAAPGAGWDGWIDASEYPRVLNPASGQIWTANSRVVGQPGLALIGDGGYWLGARGSQIRDDLTPIRDAIPADFLRIQLDDRALFLDRWRDLALQLLTAPAERQSPQRELAAGLLHDTELRASIDSQAYRLVREFRNLCFARIRDFLTLEARQTDPDYKPRLTAMFEGALWQLVTDRPMHLLDPRYESWSGYLLDILDEALANLASDRDGQLRSWGDGNVLQINHPLGGLPVLGKYLNMPSHPAPGDTFMPRVQGVSFGATERFAVAPGREREGYFHMPGGQSGHPLSAFYRAGFRSWELGEPLPFLPGETQSQLELVPVTNR